MTSEAPAMPFHSGETKVQALLGVHSHVMSYGNSSIHATAASRILRGTALAIAARDGQDRMWSTLLTRTDGETNLVSSPNSTSLLIRGVPVAGDALGDALKPGSDLGILGIEFATKRRNRVNGRITKRSSEGIEFHVDQSFGNCPQYIKPRKWWSVVENPQKPSDQHDGCSITSSTRLEEERSMNQGRPSEREQPSALRTVSTELSVNQMKTIRDSETVFIATGVRGEGQDPRWGNDASHRGGPRGWVGVRDSKTLLFPDFSGNNHFNSIGNLLLDNRMGVTFPLFETGGMIQLTGTATVDFLADETKEQTAGVNCHGAKRIIEFRIDQVVELPEGSLPIRWTNHNMEDHGRILEVAWKEKESADVTSFFLVPRPGDRQDLWAFKPGQHLPISIQSDEKAGQKTQVLGRTYSLSSSPDWTSGYRISVKREPLGAASTYLHDRVHVGDTIQVHPPAGDFVLEGEKQPTTSSDKDTTLVLLSAGVGVTPMLSMLHSVVQTNHKLPTDRRRNVRWVHGARDGAHHPFREEVRELSDLGGVSVTTHVAYSKPRDGDTEYDSKGRVTVNLLQKLLPDIERADFYMCGTSAFMAEIESGLEDLGVDPKRIKLETF